jgi:hypothetical protein
LQGMIRKAEEKAVEEFLQLEMKLRRHELGEVKRIFRPRKEGTDVMYVEFAEKEDVGKIYRAAKKVKNRHVNLINYIPASFHDRFWAIEAQCYLWRREERKWRPKVWVGREDLLLMRKRREDTGYREYPLKDLELPNYNPRFAQGQERTEVLDSPPPGRPRNEEEPERTTEDDEETRGRQRKRTDRSTPEKDRSKSKKRRRRSEGLRTEEIARKAALFEKSQEKLPERQTEGQRTGQRTRNADKRAVNH